MHENDLYKLIVAVIKQAKFDYIKALRKNDKYQIHKLEEFFLSDYGQTMALNQGERIIQYCRKIAKRKDKRNG